MRRASTANAVEGTIGKAVAQAVAAAGLSISARRAAAWQARLSWREVSGLTRVTERFG